MKRRETISSLGGLLLTAGCTSSTDRNADVVGLVLENNSTESRSVAVTVVESDVLFEETFEIGPGSRVSRDGILDAGRYTVTVDVANVGEETEDWHMNGCEENDIVALFDESIVIGATCYDD